MKRTREATYESKGNRVVLRINESIEKFGYEIRRYRYIILTLRPNRRNDHSEFLQHIYRYDHAIAFASGMSVVKRKASILRLRVKYPRLSRLFVELINLCHAVGRQKLSYGTFSRKASSWYRALSYTGNEDINIVMGRNAYWIVIM